MMLEVALFAQLEGLNPLNPTAPVSKSSGLVLKDMLLIVGACLVLALILFAWAKMYVQSKHRRHQDRHRHRERKPASTQATHESEMDEDRNERGSQRRRKRRRVRDHRPRNPTLAETGGLPPEKSPPASPQAP